MARRRFVEDQNTILELIGNMQELQNEINCMKVSKDFQDAESSRSGNFFVTNQPMLFPKHPIPEGMLRPSFVSPRRKEGTPCTRETRFFGKRFLQIQMRLHQHRIRRNYIHAVPVPKSRSIRPRWRRVKDQNKIEI